jgi:hypothetical protein
MQGLMHRSYREVRCRTSRSAPPQLRASDYSIRSKGEHSVRGREGLDQNPIGGVCAPAIDSRFLADEPSFVPCLLIAETPQGCEGPAAVLAAVVAAVGLRALEVLAGPTEDEVGVGHSVRPRPSLRMTLACCGGRSGLTYGERWWSNQGGVGEPSGSQRFGLIWLGWEGT